MLTRGFLGGLKLFDLYQEHQLPMFKVLTLLAVEWTSECVSVVEGGEHYLD